MALSIRHGANTDLSAAVGAGQSPGDEGLE
jgi:hypothetical protein